MLSRDGICRPSAYDQIEIERLQKLVQETIDILNRCPQPDIFLGRKTYEPFPWENDAPMEKAQLREEWNVARIPGHAAHPCIGSHHEKS
ncbi:hypothetical protein [Bradyrhizobium sp. CCBAU 11357]|uniref:hypothetical protein n=1 Tax=Bradyrhizobium sp. CCBAU 11357 TaxID=1630808 RepID=UPI0023038564|nr:hypothetical protein [Bradyrhizobium sp. CCBAU 11357]